MIDVMDVPIKRLLLNCRKRLIYVQSYLLWVDELLVYCSFILVIWFNDISHAFDIFKEGREVKTVEI